MGTALYISAKKKPREFDLMINGKALARAEEELNPVCAHLGVKRPMDFFGMSSRDIADLTGQDMPQSFPAKWFEAAEGMTTIRALLHHLDSDPELAARSAGLVEDLRECERVLSHLEEKKIPWHFSMDI